MTARDDVLRRSEAVGPRIARIAPAVAALLYPVALHALYGAGRLVHDATSLESALSAWAITFGAATLVYSVPAIALWAIQALGQERRPRFPRVRARAFAHLAFASPPLFTALGVALYLVHSSIDHIVWALIWLPIVAVAIFDECRFVAVGAEPRMQLRWLRTAHGLSAAAILVMFLAPHIANHLTAIWSTDLHKAMMGALRVVYRQSAVQSVLIGLLQFQIVGGMTLLRSRIGLTNDRFGSLQTASAAYLAAFIASHLVAVFILGRQVLHVDTNWDFVVGAPAGVMGDPWNVRLVPHYSLAVFLLSAHVACGLRAILLAHHATLGVANRFSVAMITLGGVIALTITLSMLGIHATA